MFGFLRHLTSLTADGSKVKAEQLVGTYPEDIGNDIKDEIIQFSELLKTDLAEFFTEVDNQDVYELKLFRLINDNSLGTCFPNVEIILRIYLTLIVTNCSGELSFSKLKRIKNELRASNGARKIELFILDEYWT